MMASYAPPRVVLTLCRNAAVAEALYGSMSVATRARRNRWCGATLLPLITAQAQSDAPQRKPDLGDIAQGTYVGRRHFRFQRLIQERRDSDRDAHQHQSGADFVRLRQASNGGSPVDHSHGQDSARAWYDYVPFGSFKESSATRRELLERSELGRYKAMTLASAVVGGTRCCTADRKNKRPLCPGASGIPPPAPSAPPWLFSAPEGCHVVQSVWSRRTKRRRSIR